MSGDHRDLHVLTHSFPTRRSSDLRGLGRLPRMLKRTLAVLATVTLFSLAACGGDDTGDSGDPKNSDNESKGTCTYTPEGQSRSEEHTSELQSLMRISYAVFCLKKKKSNNTN